MKSMCIDKLDVRVPRKTQFTPEFHEVYRHAASQGQLRPSQYYAQTADFRRYGYPIRLHMFSNYGRKINGKSSHDHKLELYDTGEMKFDEMLTEFTRVFICDPLELEMLRRDICVDVVGVSLDWFKIHARIELKRNMREIGYMNVIARKGETFYLGSKPNQFRFYNKVAERLYQYDHMLREAEKIGIPIGSFLEVFGHSESAIITRIERQYGGSQCGGKLRSLQKIDRGNPFEPIKFLKSSGREINPCGMDSTMFWAAQHLQRMVRDNGVQYVRAHMSNLVGSKNVKKTWVRYTPYLLPSEDDVGLDEETIYQLYLKSMMLQMGFCGD
jgi:hypothetical protein